MKQPYGLMGKCIALKKISKLFLALNPSVDSSFGIAAHILLHKDHYMLCVIALSPNNPRT
jgi:hypothetical protein